MGKVSKVLYGKIRKTFWVEVKRVHILTPLLTRCGTFLLDMATSFTAYLSLFLQSENRENKRIHSVGVL